MPVRSPQDKRAWLIQVFILQVLLQYRSIHPVVEPIKVSAPFCLYTCTVLNKISPTIRMDKQNQIHCIFVTF